MSGPETEANVEPVEKEELSEAQIREEHAAIALERAIAVADAAASAAHAAAATATTAAATAAAESFVRACEAGDLKKVKELWFKRVITHIDHYPPDGNQYGTPLGYAVVFCERAGSAAIVKFLLDKGASLFPRNGACSPMTHLAGTTMVKGSTEHQVWQLMLDRIMPHITKANTPTTKAEGGEKVKRGSSKSNKLPRASKETRGSQSKDKPRQPKNANSKRISVSDYPTSLTQSKSVRAARRGKSRSSMDRGLSKPRRSASTSVDSKEEGIKEGSKLVTKKKKRMKRKVDPKIAARAAEAEKRYMKLQNSAKARKAKAQGLKDAALRAPARETRLTAADKRKIWAADRVKIRRDKRASVFLKKAIELHKAENQAAEESSEDEMFVVLENPKPVVRAMAAEAVVVLDDSSEDEIAVVQAEEVVILLDDDSEDEVTVVEGTDSDQTKPKTEDESEQ